MTGRISNDRSGKRMMKGDAQPRSRSAKMSPLDRDPPILKGRTAKARCRCIWTRR
jgi:hypothetical protein